MERPPRTGSAAAQASPSTVAKLQPEGAEQGLTRAGAGPSASSVDPPYLAEAPEETERLSPGSAARARRSSASLDPPHMPGHEKEAERSPPRSGGRALRLAASLHPASVTEPDEEDAERSPPRAVARPSNVPTKPRYTRGAPANEPESLTTEKARQILSDNDKVIDYDAVFFRKRN